MKVLVCGGPSRRLPALPILDTVTRHFPVERGYSCPVTVVVLVGQPGAYTARIGHGDPEWVAESGHLLNFAQARGHFPGVRFEDYIGGFNALSMPAMSEPV